MSTFSSFAKQDLLLEFASLKVVSPEGVYVTITPGDASLWTGVLFIRKGPYAPAILRFQIIFPALYPSSPPLITFSSEVFHPLLTPLTTYTYTTSGSSSDTVSASDEERLPPGGFSLRHGFPQWFISERRRTGSLSTISEPPSVYEILEYMRAAFSSEEMLNAIPLEAAANPGAFHAWHSFRTSLESSSSKAADRRTSLEHRKPGEWNWDGVWEERVRRGVQASQSESVIFGHSGGDDIIRFGDLDAGGLAKVINKMEAVYGATAS